MKKSPEKLPENHDKLTKKLTENGSIITVSKVNAKVSVNKINVSVKRGRCLKR